MIEEKYLDIISSISDCIGEKTLHLLGENLSDGEETSIVINLVISIHLSAMSNLMKLIAREDTSVLANIDKFLSALLNFMHQDFGLFFVKARKDH